jgi:TcpE family
VELPTYTNIWKIEKRLYKLYDFRLPMPLPVGQIVAFLAIAVPYTFILTMAGMPFSHTWIWLYVLPPAVLAWLATRPVLEGKRLPELVLSQLRYLGEPRTWCRMAPLAEQDEMVVLARVWRSARYVRPVAEPAPAVAVGVGAGSTQGSAPPVPGTIPARTSGQAWPVPAGQRRSVTAGRARPAPAEQAAPAPADRARPAWPASPVRSRAGADPGPGRAAPRQVAAATAQPVPAREAPAAARPVVTVTGDSQVRPLNVVERALRSSPAGRAGWHEPVLVVPGGHRPGRPDQAQRDQARARLPLSAPARIVVLGCTAGAGQTITTLLTGQLLASLRGAAVAVLDLSDGPGSLTEQARSISLLLPSHRAGAGLAAGRPGAGSGERGLQVVTAGGSVDDAGQIINSVVERYPLTLADPGAGCVPRGLRVADQLILVAPASADAPSSLAMTLEWLEAHDYSRLAGMAITVLNGVSVQSARHVDKAAAVASGRCRAIVRVPWDERMRGQAGPGLGTATVLAYTALAGVLVSGLADAATRSAAR